MKINPLSFFTDQKGTRLYDVAEIPVGQINVTYPIKNQVNAWKKHAIQTDYWVVLQGEILAGIKKENEQVKFRVLRSKEILEIPPETWHGYMALTDDCIMLYYLTEKYDPSDEVNAAPGDFNEQWKY